MVSEEASTDVEMKSEDASECGNQKETNATKDPDTLTLEDLKEHVRHIEKSVSTKEPRFVLRVLRSLVSTRKKLNPFVLRKLVSGYLCYQPQQKDALLGFIEELMDTDGPVTPFRSRTSKSSPLMPEIETYIHLLIILHLIDTEKIDKALQCSNLLMQKLQAINRRTLDILAAKCYFYHSRCYELTGKLASIRSFLHSRLRTATLRNDYEGQAVLLNCLLRNYLHYNLFDQADKLVTKSIFPVSASNNEWARYLFYLGRIKATQLDYSEAHKNLTQALRKAPQHSAVGFKQMVQKLAITVELLLGDIPDRSMFRQPTYRRTLAPYFQLTQAVKAGNLARFNEVLENFGSKFQTDNTYTLIIRLRHNVIKTGVRMISLSYSRISFLDIANKLQLNSSEDAEYIVAKAIRDGVIEANITSYRGSMQSKENIDIYCTREPQDAFHQRISFCLDIHNQSVKAMRFPAKSYHKDLESAEDRREREQQDIEYAKEMADEDDDAFP